MKQTLIILALIFCVVLIALVLLSFLLRVLVGLGLRIAAKTFRKSRKSSKAHVPAHRPKKTDEVLMRVKNNRSHSYQKLPAVQDRAEIEETKIVDFVRPVGFWTSMVFGQKLTYLLSSAKLINQKSKRGFWVSMVEAQALAQGRQRGKGRG